MKKNIGNILIGMTLGMLVSCVEEGTFQTQTFASLKPYYLNIESSSIDRIASNATTVTITVQSMETGWRITDIPSWLSVQPSSGEGTEEVTVTVQENKSTSASRTAVLTLESTDKEWNFSLPFTASQDRSLCFANAEKSSYSADGKSQQVIVPISSNVADWAAQALSDLSAWAVVTKNPDNKAVVVELQPNVSNVSRTGTVRLTTGDSETGFTITQRPANVTSSLTEVGFDVMGGTKVTTVSSDASWTVATSQSWINVTPAGGAAGTQSLSIETTPNYTLTERNGYVYVVLSDESEIEIPVSQDCIHFGLDKYSLEYPSTASERTLNVSSNVGWKVADGRSEWLSPNPENGNANAKVTVKATDNGETYQRTGRISFTPVELDYAREVAVTQAGHIFSYDSTSVSFSDKAGRTGIEITSDGTWNARSLDEWIAVTPETSQGNSIMTVSVTENTDSVARQGTVVISLGSTQYNITVCQQGKFINISNSSLDFSSTGGFMKLDITTNDSISATVSDGADWIRISKDLVVEVIDNPSLTARDGVVVLRPANLKPINVEIHQAARYMQCQTGQQKFFSKGGTSENIVIETDGQCSISADDDWISINRLSDALFTITVSPNANWFSRESKVHVELTGLVSGELVHDISVFQEEFRDPLVVTVADVSFSMIPVRGGEFTMGSPAGAGFDESECPQHKVTLSDFYIGETEVTQALWNAVMAGNPSTFNTDPNLPVETVTWNACIKFVRRLSELTGKKFRMPTEAEWEYAARGGVYSKGYAYSGSDNIDDVAWYSKTAADRTHPVRQLAPNELGLYDMSGNVEEWCIDWYSAYGSDSKTNPSGPVTGTVKVNRGGYALSYAADCRSAYRGLNAAPTYIFKYLGLRVVISDLEIATNYNDGIVDIPDAAFKNSLVSQEYDLDGDMEISFTEAPHITSISSVQQAIGTIQGVEAFQELSVLNVNGNMLTEMNLTANVKLTELYCSNNQLRVLDISCNSNLTGLDCSWNPSLDTIYVWDGFKAADYPNFIKPDKAVYVIKSDPVVPIPDAALRDYMLAEYDIDHNGLFTESEALLITSLTIDDDNILSLDGLEALTGLTSLTVKGSGITEIDLSAFTDLTALTVERTGVSGDMDLTAFGLLNTLSVSGSSIRYVFVNGLKPAYAISGGARFVVVDIPVADDVFRNSIIGNFDSDHNGKLSQLEVEEVTSLDVSGKSISSLGGIEFFKALETLDCSDNSLTELDLSQTAVTCVNVSGNAGLKRVIVPAGFDEAMYRNSTMDNQTYLVPADKLQSVTAGNVSFDMIGLSGTFNGKYIQNFFISQTEVTQKLWKAVMGSNPSTFINDNLPVDNISWSEAREFVRKLSQMTGRNFRLPTEMEWEFAARGGSWTKDYTYSGSNDIAKVAWYKLSRGSQTTHQVATALPNELGLYDMSGNVIEWCMDWYGETFMPDTVNVFGPDTGTGHVLRGGSWNDDASACTVSARAQAQDKKYQDIGLRIVLDGQDVADSYYGTPVNVPDAIFKAYLLTNFDSNKDGVLTIREAQAIKTVNIANKGNIEDLTGIEFMTGMTSLYCNGNSIASLNLANNTALKTLVCSNNMLQTLDISRNTALKTLNAVGNADLTVVYVWAGFVASDYTGFVVGPDADYMIKH